MLDDGNMSQLPCSASQSISRGCGRKADCRMVITGSSSTGKENF